MRAIRIFALLLGLAGVAIAFQNCGEGFQSQFDEEFASLASAAPVIQVTNAPGDLSNQRTVTIGIEVIANQYATVKSVTCVLDDNAPADCGEVFMAVDLLDGDHVLKINATDSRGNVAV
jgi:hypothetical protein